MLRHMIPETVRLRLDLQVNSAPVLADATQMQQVLMNLCINGCQAMPEGGDMTLGLAEASLDEEYCRQRVHVSPGRYTCLSVRDTGVGMTPAVQARLFEPFFTTKDVGHGTGLGLAVVYGIVQAYGGHVRVSSDAGRGSEFRVYLPWVEGVKSRTPTPTREQPARGTETILLVEDEVVLLSVIKAMLQSLGYSVLTALNGSDALATFRGDPSRVNLVIADMVMPGKGVRELYQELVGIDPGVKLLLMSGYSREQEVSELMARGVRGFIRKPFKLVEFARAVRQAIEG